MLRENQTGKRTSHIWQPKTQLGQSSSWAQAEGLSELADTSAVGRMALVGAKVRRVGAGHRRSRRRRVQHNRATAPATHQHRQARDRVLPLTWVLGWGSWLKLKTLLTGANRRSGVSNIAGRGFAPAP